MYGKHRCSIVRNDRVMTLITRNTLITYHYSVQGINRYKVAVKIAMQKYVVFRYNRNLEEN